MVNRKRFYPLIYTYCFLLSIPIWSIEFQPWVGNYLEFEWSNHLFYQTYSAVDSNSYLKQRSASDLFLTTNLGNSIIPEGSIAIEATMAHTRQQRFDLDNIRLAGRYMWLDDILGDYLSLTTGLILTHAFKSSLYDISSFHHGRTEAELFVSVGKEISSLTKTWCSRWWSTGGIGIAEQGSPWLRAQFIYEHQICDRHRWRVFGKTLWGLGHHRLCIQDFRGYGPVRHQSIDLGLGYTYLIKFFGSVSFEYSYRVYARNFPVQNHQFLLSLLYTFGL